MITLPKYRKTTTVVYKGEKRKVLSIAFEGGVWWYCLESTFGWIAEYEIK